MLTFAYNESSWDKGVLPGSMADLIGTPIQQHLPEGTWQVRREPEPGTVNLYSSSRTAYHTEVPRAEEQGSVLLSHGIADKGIRLNLRDMYQHVVCPGRMHAEVLRDAGMSKASTPILGYPKMDPLFNGSMRGVPKDGRIRVLFAPTQGGGGDMNHMHDTEPPAMSAAKRSSWWRRAEVLAQLDPDAHDVVLCPHPRYTPGHKATLQQYVGADVVIADGGSTLWEAMALGIPIVLPAWITAEGHARKRTAEAGLYQPGKVRLASDPSLLPKLVLEASYYGPTKDEERLGREALPFALRGCSGEAHAEWLTKTYPDALP